MRLQSVRKRHIPTLLTTLAPDVTMTNYVTARQGSLPGMCPVTDAVNQLSLSGVEERGAIFTRREVVDFILDLVGYTAKKKLYRSSLLEPSFGNGDFLLVAIERLLDSYQSRRGDVDLSVRQLAPCIRGVELHAETFNRTRSKIDEFLKQREVKSRDREHLISAWLRCADFLLLDFDTQFSHVVGNPPYVRQELVPDALIAEYRRRYMTVFDRADIYIPFIERSLQLLAQNGSLGFICADRWMKNRYGGPLRRLIAEKYHLKYFVDMVDTDAFHSEVIAYPAITVITREAPGATRIAHQPKVNGDTLRDLAAEFTRPIAKTGLVTEFSKVAVGDAPWLLHASDQLTVVRRLESVFPIIEDAGCKIGIGVATGADEIFIAPIDELDVETERKLPLVMTRDIVTGVVQWRGYGVLNPFTDEGPLVNLKDYPRFSRYLDKHAASIKSRHVSKKNPNGWYRTIDRIYPELARTPKLLIPDIKGEAQVVFDDGSYYPHHNLYYITSDTWDLHALQAVLKSGIARLFVSTYSTKMRGGFLRFQAQYLRRIRIPHWQNVSTTLRKRLIAAAKSGKGDACNSAVAELYGLSDEERFVLNA